jgi:long-subunit fatty acid transport protein
VIKLFSMQLVVLCLFVFLLSLLLSVGYSLGFDQVPVSAKALSMGNAVTAYPLGPMSIHFNPACLSALNEKAFTFGATALLSMKIKSSLEISPDYEFDLLLVDEPDPLPPAAGSVTDGAMKHPVFGSRDDLFTINMGFSRRKPGSKWTFGFGMYSPHFMGFTREEDSDPGRFGGKRSYKQRFVYAAPSLACQVTETFSIGFAIALGQTYRGLKSDFRASSDILEITRILGEATDGLEIPILSELTLPEPWFNGGLPAYETMAKLKMDMKDNLDTSYNIGMLWEPFSWVSLGACYRSEAKSEPTGSYAISYSPQFQEFAKWFGESPLTVQIASIFGLPIGGTPVQQGTVTMRSSKEPQNAQFGIMLQPFKGLRMMCDATWTDWSTIKSEVYQFDQPIQLFQVAGVGGYSNGPQTYIIPRHLKDIWNLSFGVEISPFEWLSLRAGYYEKESYVRDKYFEMSLPLQDMDVYSAGLWMKLGSRWSIDMTGIYMESDTYRNNYTEGSLISSEALSAILHNPFKGMDYEQKSRASWMSISFNYIW